MLYHEVCAGGRVSLGCGTSGGGQQGGEAFDAFALSEADTQCEVVQLDEDAAFCLWMVGKGLNEMGQPCAEEIG